MSDTKIENAREELREIIERTKSPSEDIDAQHCDDDASFSSEGAGSRRILQLCRQHPSLVEEYNDNMPLLSILVANPETTLETVQQIYELCPKAARIQGHRRRFSLHWACENASEEIILFLARKYPVAMIKGDEDGNYPVDMKYSYHRDFEDPRLFLEVMESYEEGDLWDLDDQIKDIEFQSNDMAQSQIDAITDAYVEKYTICLADLEEAKEDIEALLAGNEADWTRVTELLHTYPILASEKYGNGTKTLLSILVEDKNASPSLVRDLYHMYPMLWKLLPKMSVVGYLSMPPV